MSSDWPAGIGRLVLDEVDSTNAEALRRTDLGDTWILAHRQSAGRGRRGRVWHMAPGNFAASLSLGVAGTPADAALYSFVAALALRDALAGLTERPLTLKWPNDVLLAGGKVAGILLETVGAATAGRRLIIGFGVNLAAAPADDAIEPGAIVPVALDVAVQPEIFLDRLAPAFARRDAAFRAHGFAPLREEWLRHAARLGEDLTARTGDTVRAGRFETVDEAGALVLVSQGRRHAIPAADVYF